MIRLMKGVVAGKAVAGSVVRIGILKHAQTVSDMTQGGDANV